MLHILFLGSFNISYAHNKKDIHKILFYFDKILSIIQKNKNNIKKLIKIKIVDEIIKEPLGGAHRDYKEISESVRSCILRNLGTLLSKPLDDLLEARYKKLLEIG